MSAWLLTDTHISVLVGARTRFGPSPTVFPNIDDDALGRTLLRENMLSLATRYGDKIDEDRIARYRTDPSVAQRFGAVAIIKAVHCYQYQACEHDAWPESDAYEYCKQLIEHMTQHLPGYGDAAWAIGPEHLKEAAPRTRRPRGA
jgi:hypothetical protein